MSESRKTRIRLRIEYLAAVGMDGLARAIEGIFGGQKDVGGGHFGGLAGVLEGRGLAKFFDLVGREAGGNKWRPAEARRYRVGPYLLLG